MKGTLFPSSSNKLFTDKITKADLFEYLSICQQFADLNIEDAIKECFAAAKHHDKKQFKLSEMKNLLGLQRRWYYSLHKKKPDYSVYSDPYYFCEAWLCWSKYSRQYLKTITSEKSLFGGSISSSIKNPKTILDLGCGAGYTTAALKQIFHKSDVVGTNIKDSSQYKMASSLGKRYGFNITSSVIKIKADFVFASEYFEHFVDPVHHLVDVIKQTNFRYILFANTFSSKAIGHFDTYRVNGGSLKGREVGKAFREALRDHGYVKVKTNLWNDRPSFWKAVK